MVRCRGGTSTMTLSALRPDEQQALEELQAFLRIPSISTLPEHSGDVRRAADRWRQRLDGFGIDGTVHS